MQRIFDHIRQHLLDRAGYSSRVMVSADDYGKHPDLDSLRASEGNREFYRLMQEHYRNYFGENPLMTYFRQLMRNRLVMGSFRYDLWNEKKDSKWDLFSSMWRRLDNYQRTGNTEMLVDVANYIQIEYTFPSNQELQLTGFRSRPDYSDPVSRAASTWICGYITGDCDKSGLVEAARILEEEFIAPKHPLAHWSTVDDGEHTQRAKARK